MISGLPTLPSLPSPDTLLFIQGLLLVPVFVFSWSCVGSRPSVVRQEEGDICGENVEDLLSPCHQKPQILSVQKVNIAFVVQSCLFFSPQRSGPGSPAGIWSVFPSQKAAGNGQITVICLFSFSGRAVNLFHLGNNSLLAVPPAQTQAAGEQQELRSLAQV